MGKLTALFFVLLISLSLNLSASEQTAASQPPAEGEKLSGQALLKQDQEQIALLKAKLEELKATGDDGAVIQAYVQLAQEMEELNNKRHALHQAVKGFEKGVGVFSDEIKAIIKKVNDILVAQSTVAINNAKVASLLKQPQQVANPLALVDATVDSKEKGKSA